MRRALLLCLTLVLLGCTPAPPAAAPPSASETATTTPSAPPSPSPSTSPSITPSGPGTRTASPTSPTTPAPAVGRFRAAAALDTVRRLAGHIGPREATSASFRRAADMVGRRLRGFGYDVRRQRLSVPAGESWEIPVPAGRTANVVATPVGFDATAPHVVVGAHLDTVPQAPGAEDNASGVAVLLELARLSARAALPMPVVFVAFAAEEPRGPGDDDHHFGSQAYVAAMRLPERDALAGMVSLDRVGVGRSVPVCTGGLSPRTVATALLQTAQRAGIAAQPCESRTSDHWPFEKAGFRVARLGGTDYPEYHSSRDVPSVVSSAQLTRVGRLLWSQLRSGFPR